MEEQLFVLLHRTARTVLCWKTVCCERDEPEVGRKVRLAVESKISLISVMSLISALKDRLWQHTCTFL